MNATYDYLLQVTIPILNFKLCLIVHLTVALAVIYQEYKLSFFNYRSFMRMSKWAHFKALAKEENTSAIADHMEATGRHIKWDHLDILASSKTGYRCKIKETLNQELKPALNSNVSDQKFLLC